MRGQLPFNLLVIALIAVVVLVVSVLLFSGELASFNESADQCEYLGGTCAASCAGEQIGTCSSGVCCLPPEDVTLRADVGEPVVLRVRAPDAVRVEAIVRGPHDETVPLRPSRITASVIGPDDSYAGLFVPRSAGTYSVTIIDEDGAMIQQLIVEAVGSASPSFTAEPLEAEPGTPLTITAGSDGVAILSGPMGVQEARLGPDGDRFTATLEPDNGVSYLALRTDVVLARQLRIERGEGLSGQRIVPHVRLLPSEASPGQSVEVIADADAAIIDDVEIPLAGSISSGTFEAPEPGVYRVDLLRDGERYRSAVSLRVSEQDTFSLVSIPDPFVLGSQGYLIVETNAQGEELLVDGESVAFSTVASDGRNLLIATIAPQRAGILPVSIDDTGIGALEVIEPRSCTATRQCSGFCVAGSCRPVCASAGERASEGSCCTGLSWEDGSCA